MPAMTFRHNAGSLYIFGSAAVLAVAEFATSRKVATRKKYDQSLEVYM